MTVAIKLAKVAHVLWIASAICEVGLDLIKAHDLERALQGKLVGGYVVEKYLNHGKSAAVFRASKDGSPAAVKIFDDELIERYGDKAQLRRIDRELTLIGHTHQNLVKILAGGFDNITKNHYIVMEFLDGPNLRQCLENVPNEVIPKLIEQLAGAAKFLESRGLVHRDIKPENIILLDGCQRLVLLDLGVLRPIGEAGLTDGEGVQAFVGTLQYSSPEFLLREEEDTIDGWRALTFYQIGGVIHDLLMRRPLFDEFVNPYGRLVMAVQQEVPVVQSSTAPRYLVNLANLYLAKKPSVRLRFINWDNFNSPTNAAPVSPKDEVAKRLALRRAIVMEVPQGAANITDAELRIGIVEYLKVAARSIRTTGSLPPITTALFPRDGSGLCISFDPSSEHQLPNGLKIYTHVDVLDASAKAIIVRGLACVDAEKPEPSKLAHQLFGGIYEVPPLHEAFENFIYDALLWAQEGACNGGYWPVEDGDR